MLSPMRFVGHVGVFCFLLAAAAQGQEHRFVGDGDTVAIIEEGDKGADVFHFHLGANRPTNLSEEAVRREAQAALDTWEAGGSRVKFSLGETIIDSYRLPESFIDELSVLTMFVMAKDDFYRHAGFNILTHSMAVPRYTDGVLKSCDILLNAVDFAWSAMPQTPEGHMDLQSVLLHEIGHCLGLPHMSAWLEGVFSPGAMLSTLVKGEQRRALSGQDRTKLQTFYPVRGQGARCDSAGDCAGGTACVQQAVHSGISKGYCASSCLLGEGDAAACLAPTKCLPPPDSVDTDPPEFFEGEGKGACLLPTFRSTPVGEACPSNSCNTVSDALCLSDNDFSSGWPNNYCSKLCLGGHGICPDGSRCRSFPSGGAACVKKCAVRSNDCRPFYTCVPVNPADTNEDENEGECLDKCTNPYRTCPTGYWCRPWDGRCIAQQSPSASIGDRCETNADCGRGQKCWSWPSVPHKTCVARCRMGEPPCPGGSVCASVGEEAEPLCMSVCESRERCPLSMQCASVGHCKACLPPCKDLRDCPGGSIQCLEGQCLGPDREGGGELGDGSGGGIGGLNPDEKPPPKKKSSGCTAVQSSSWVFLALGLGWVCLRLRRKGIL